MFLFGKWYSNFQILTLSLIPWPDSWCKFNFLIYVSFCKYTTTILGKWRGERVCLSCADHNTWTKSISLAHTTNKEGRKQNLILPISNYHLVEAFTYSILRYARYELRSLAILKYEIAFRIQQVSEWRRAQQRSCWRRQQPKLQTILSLENPNRPQKRRVVREVFERRGTISLDKTLIIWSSTTLSLLHRLVDLRGHLWSGLVWDVKTDKCVQVINDHSMPVIYVNYIS